MRILVVDDEAKLARVVEEMLELAGHEVEAVTSGRDALARFGAAPVPYELVLTDLRMPDLDGIAVLAAARRLPSPPAVIVMTAFGTTESAVAAMKAGAIDYLVKPFAMDELRLRVARIAEQRAAATTEERLVEQLAPALVAESPAMRAVIETARRVAQRDATVLLLGETGTGKNQLARLIHFAGPRRSKPLVEVHCAALPEPLLESELFGHQQGAFTGADRTRTGLLAAADQGTLVLDEIGEISLSTQVKLLRFLEAKEFVPLGGSVIQKVNARVIAATNRDLEAAVQAGSFREDLYYRLNVVPLVVPPLRERTADLVPIAERFLTSRGVPKTKLSPEARRALLDYSWPGNVRELENALERALILAGEEPIGREHLVLRAPPRAAQRAEKPQTLAELAADALALPAGDFDLDAFERILLASAIERMGQNKSAAARILGITRRRLYSRLKSLNERAEEDPG
jgi:DNA-binding NtrC family response regulator